MERLHGYRAEDGGFLADFRFGALGLWGLGFRALGLGLWGFGVLGLGL